MYTEGLLHEHSRLEDEYFYKKDRELIEKLREKERQKQDLLERTAHYHKCAKCGHGMEEKIWGESSFLACTSCNSLHLSLSTLEKIQQHGKLKVFFTEVNEAMRVAQEAEKESA